MSTAGCPGLLFDLDGTLVDSAPDLVGTLNDLRTLHGLEAIPEAPLRPLATRGAMGLLAAGFDLDRQSPDQIEALRDAFIERYRQRLWQLSRPFAGIDELLRDLHQRNVRLAIVTNKMAMLAEALVSEAGWTHLFLSLVAGDSTAHPKPDPLPVLTACRALDLAPADCIMIGDDRRDIQAGRAAGTQTIVAGWGYIAASERPGDWGADAIVDTPQSLADLLESKLARN